MQIGHLPLDDFGESHHLVNRSPNTSQDHVVSWLLHLRSNRVSIPAGRALMRR